MCFHCLGNGPFDQNKLLFHRGPEDISVPTHHNIYFSPPANITASFTGATEAQPAY